MTTELADHVETWNNLPDLVRRLWEVRQEISDLQSEERTLTQIVKAHCEKTGEVLEVEGVPPVRTVRRSSGWTWDSHAIQNIIDKHPHEWQKLLGLEAVALKSSVINDALKRAALLMRPEGGIEGWRTELHFDRVEHQRRELRKPREEVDHDDLPNE